MALLAEGRHCDALARCGMSEPDFCGHWQDQRFRRVLRALHEVIEDIRRIKRHDHLDQRSYESDKVAMFIAERLDPRYVPPQVIARQGDKTNIQAVQINVMLPNGRPVGDHGGAGDEKQKIYGGFFERMLGSEPNNIPTEPTDPDNTTDPMGSATGASDGGDATDGGEG